MSGASLSISGSIIGIFFQGMTAAKRRVCRAQEVAQSEGDSLSRAISSLQVEDGRLRQRAEALDRLRSRINRRMVDLQRISGHIDYVEQRFEETDNLCARRIKTGSYAVRKSVGLVSGGGIFGNVIGGLVSVVSKGITAWKDTNKLIADGIKYVFRNEIAAAKYAAKAIGDFYEKHKVVINNIAAIVLEAGAIVLTVAGIAALSLTGAGLVVAVGVAAAGIAYSAGNIVDSGVKLYNYCTKGEETGFNPLQKGFQAVLGNELGEEIYNYTGIGLTVANVAMAGAGLVKAGIQIKNALQSGKTLKEALTIGRRLEQGGSQVVKNVAQEEQAIKEMAEVITHTTARAAIQRMSSFMDDIGMLVAREGLDLPEFTKLRLTPPEMLSTEDLLKLKRIRDSIPMPTEDTLLSKVITKSARDNFINNGQYSDTIGGYFARAQDTKNLFTYDEYYNVLRLDYSPPGFDPIHEEFMSVIRFKTDNSLAIKIPYGGVSNADLRVVEDVAGIPKSELIQQKWPFSGNGFTVNEGSQTVPEFVTKSGRYMTINEGAVIYDIYKDGTEVLRAIFIEGKWLAMH